MTKLQFLPVNNFIVTKLNSVASPNLVEVALYLSKYHTVFTGSISLFAENLLPKGRRIEDIDIVVQDMKTINFLISKIPGIEKVNSEKGRSVPTNGIELVQLRHKAFDIKIDCFILPSPPNRSATYDNIAHYGYSLQAKLDIVIDTRQRLLNDIQCSIGEYGRQIARTAFNKHKNDLLGILELLTP